MSEQELIVKSKTVLIEVLAVLVLSLIIISILTVMDISIHDFYVKPIVAHCYVGNDNIFCTEIREKHGCDPSDQMCLGNVYWNLLAILGVFVGIIVASVRVIFALLLKSYINKKITGATVLMVITYFVIGSGLFYFGVLDTLYYVFQGEDVPQSLDWLNGAGIFTESKKWFGDPNTVEIEDLLATNVIGFIMIGLFGFATMLLYASLKKSPNGIA